MTMHITGNRVTMAHLKLAILMLAVPSVAALGVAFAAGVPDTGPPQLYPRTALVERGSAVCTIVRAGGDPRRARQPLSRG